MFNFARKTMKFRFKTNNGKCVQEYTAQVNSDGLIRYRSIDDVDSPVMSATVRDSVRLTPEELEVYETLGVCSDAEAIAILRGKEILEGNGYTLKDLPVSELWSMRHPRNMWQRLIIPNLADGEIVNVGEFRELMEMTYKLGIRGIYLCEDTYMNFEFVTYENLKELMTQFKDEDNVAIYLLTNDASSDKVKIYKTSKAVSCKYSSYTEQSMIAMQNENIYLTTVTPKRVRSK